MVKLSIHAPVYISLSMTMSKHTFTSLHLCAPTQSKLAIKVPECHGISWWKAWIFMVDHRESWMLHFNEMEVHRLPCESIIGYQWQWAIRQGTALDIHINCKSKFLHSYTFASWCINWYPSTHLHTYVAMYIGTSITIWSHTSTPLHLYVLMHACPYMQKFEAQLDTFTHLYCCACILLCTYDYPKKL